MKLRPGIFDPWRQEQESPPPQKRPALVDDETASQELVRYDGIRAGIHVRVSAGDDISESARAVLVSAVHRLSRDEGVKRVMQSWGITLGATKAESSVVLSARGKSVSITLPPSTELTARAVDTLALFFREVCYSPDLRDVVSALGITPYLK